MSTAVPPPHPDSFASMDEWARAYYGYVVAGTAIDRRVDPTPVLLPHRGTKLEPERTGQDGSLMYTPATKHVSITRDNVWDALTSSATVYRMTEVEDEATYDALSTYEYNTLYFWLEGPPPS